MAFDSTYTKSNPQSNIVDSLSFQTDTSTN